MPDLSDYEPSCEITKREFDELCNTAKWKMEPSIEQFNGCGYHDVVYMPNKRAHGVLADGRYVWAWVVGKNVKKEPADGR